MYNPFESPCIDEMIPSEYEDYLDNFQQVRFDITQDNSPKRTCPKCGELISDFEITINFGRCPCCDSQLVEKDIPI